MSPNTKQEMVMEANDKIHSWKAFHHDVPYVTLKNRGILDAVAAMGVGLAATVENGCSGRTFALNKKKSDPSFVRNFNAMAASTVKSCVAMTKDAPSEEDPAHPFGSLVNMPLGCARVPDGMKVPKAACTESVPLNSHWRRGVSLDEDSIIFPQDDEDDADEGRDPIPICHQAKFGYIEGEEICGVNPVKMGACIEVVLIVVIYRFVLFLQEGEKVYHHF
ncbi:hypothetical protein B0H13DRAFT_1914652 [Mycena leptocephala]|nr:hypothetical protein B0H13DRAFT_1914652 [Mycena leptocephala]